MPQEDHAREVGGIPEAPGRPFYRLDELSIIMENSSFAQLFIIPSLSPRRASPQLGRLAVPQGWDNAARL